jgi:hypothetical protein
MSREKILATYAAWTALSALRSGSPIKSRASLYPLIDTINFRLVLDRSVGPLTIVEFDRWHEATVANLMLRDTRLHANAGWASKIINVYLKTIAYVGDAGRDGIRECLHPPVDSGLWKGIRRQFKGNNDILQKTHCVKGIVNISTYDIYKTIVEGLRLAAIKLGCPLIEVEQLWESF